MSDDLKTAINLLKRGVKTLNRQEWEPGETNQEWELAVSSFLSAPKARMDFERETKEGE